MSSMKGAGYTLIWNNNVIHERGRPTEKWDLNVINCVEHIRKLTIKIPQPVQFLRLWYQFRLFFYTLLWAHFDLE